MRPQSVEHLLTAEEAFWLDPAARWQLVEGRIVELSPVKQRHGKILTRLAHRVNEVVERDGLGEVYTGDVGFILRRNPDTVRAPDLAFIRRGRLPAEEPETFSEVVPDLAAEILSPSDRWSDVEEKIAEYLAAGVTVVWILDPSRNEVRVHRADRALEILGADALLTEPTLLPSLRVPLRDLFA